MSENKPASRARSRPPEGPELSLFEQAHQALLGMIMSGELKPGELITERQIALQIGVSRTPLREAIRRLEGARLIERQSNGALVVRGLPIEEFIGILDVRRVLEGEAARRAAGHVPAALLARLRERAEQMLESKDGAAIGEPVPEEDLHSVIARAADNPVLVETIEGLRMRTSMFRFGRLPARRDVVAREHLAIVEALEKADATGARKAMEQHIDQVRATIIARLSGQHR